MKKALIPSYYELPCTRKSTMGTQLILVECSRLFGFPCRGWCSFHAIPIERTSWSTHPHFPLHETQCDKSLAITGWLICVYSAVSEYDMKCQHIIMCKCVVWQSHIVLTRQRFHSVRTNFCFCYRFFFFSFRSPSEFFRWFRVYLVHIECLDARAPLFLIPYVYEFSAFHLSHSLYVVI